MKRLILLPAVVVLALLSACGNGQNNQQSQSGSEGSAGGTAVSRDSTSANDGPAANSEDRKIDPEG
ncbi:hypothetical protein [Hymenobacter sp. CRA2]|uniref:hypothetical protein n=1 Tax=Hymenobacter sp. CRA2 TaxID=1955620 RepID=UPI00098F6942|nr:hypothetical protein [Hymenobacter sp. CRA2]OON66478.1 hypothetical protein B0919_21855 [Hymenobacter sp. CRA2]